MRLKTFAWIVAALLLVLLIALALDLHGGNALRVSIHGHQ